MSGQIKDDFTAFLQNGAFYIALGVAILILISIGVIMCWNRKKDKEKNINKNVIIEGLGGEDNIVEMHASGSRLSVSLKDQNLMNVDVLKNNGVCNIIQMQNKITLVLNDAKANELIKSK